MRRELASPLATAAAATAGASSSAAASLRGWWDDVNESPQWQDGAFFSLAAAYALVSAVALIQLVRIQRRVPEFGWTTQKVFHLMNFLVNGVRALVFGFHVHVFLLRTKVRSQFSSSPAIDARFQASLNFPLPPEALHLLLPPQARSLPTDKLRPAYIAVNAIIYVVQLCIWIYLGINDNAAVELASKIFIVAVSFVALLGFSVYGGRLFVLLRRFPIESKGRQKKLYEVTATLQQLPLLFNCP
ncbi:La-related protein 6C [Zea mays]|uniref:La-related protein 6C n=1 Tax=Zea mays TaxID=4577 RepID=A0A1D6HQM8_MAIZE|nr:La-related protein 6C [Zea mays]ONM50877.1 La-related protein 6C [Zea mays]